MLRRIATQHHDLKIMATHVQLVFKLNKLQWESYKSSVKKKRNIAATVENIFFIGEYVKHGYKVKNLNNI